MTLHMSARTAPELQLSRSSTPPPLPCPQLAPRPPVALPTVAMSVLGAGLGAAALITALIRPAAPAEPAHSAVPPAPVYTDAQVAAAKTKACGAWKLSSDGLIANTNRRGHLTSTRPDDEDALGMAHMANTGAAYLLAGLWLPKQVDPATPPDLKDAINLFASTARQRDYASTPDELNKVLNTLNVARLDIERLCQ